MMPSIKSRKAIHRSIRQRRGAVAVEMAITVGLVFFFFFAALEMCRVSMMRHTVEHALYEGARQGIVPGATAADVRTKAQSVMRTIGIRTAAIDVTPAVIDNSTPEVAVRIQMPLDQNLFAPAFFFRGLTLDRTFVIQREGSR
jgi:Flp pilus assembly protein TadG